MNGRIGFGVIVALIAIVGAWLTVTGRLLAWWKTVNGQTQATKTSNPMTTTDTGANMNNASGGSWGAPASTPPTLSGQPAQATVADGLLTTTFGNVSLSAPLQMPTFNLSSLTGPIGGDGFAIAPITLASWGGVSPPSSSAS